MKRNRKVSQKLRSQRRYDSLKDLHHLSLESLHFSLGGQRLTKCLTKMANLLLPVTPKVMLTALMVIMLVPLTQWNLKEDLNITMQEKSHRVNMIEEIRDISRLEVQECSNRNQDKCLEGAITKMDEDEVQPVEEKEDDEGDSNSKGEDSSDEEGDRMINNNRLERNHDGQNYERDEGSRFSGETKVSDTFNDEVCISKKKGSG
nr:glycosyltransferase family 92 [Tanacetum cinerariifolium]